MKHIILSIAAFALSLCALAQPVRLVGGLSFQGAIINDEFDVSNCELAKSGTLAAFNLTPHIGLRFGEGHQIKTGFNVTRDFGTTGDKPSFELAAWYQYNNRNGFTLAAGIFPYSMLGGRYSSAIFSDAARFYDVYVDGFLLRYNKGKSNYELALDWTSKFGETRHEQFIFLSAGEAWFTSWLALCWEGVFHHYACSVQQDGVYDDHLFHPYLQMEFSSLLPLQRLELSAGGMIGYQKDRKRDWFYTPKGADVVLEIRNWNFGVRNQFYYGDNQLPLYETNPDMYFRATWWQVRKDDLPGLYNNLDCYWTKSLNSYVTLGLHAAFHFDRLGYLGCQQFFQASVNLDKLSIAKSSKKK